MVLLPSFPLGSTVDHADRLPSVGGLSMSSYDSTTNRPSTENMLLPADLGTLQSVTPPSLTSLMRRSYTEWRLPHDPVGASQEFISTPDCVHQGGSRTSRETSGGYSQDHDRYESRGLDRQGGDTYRSENSAETSSAGHSSLHQIGPRDIEGNAHVVIVIATSSVKQ